MKIDILILNYNGEKIIENTIEYCKNQKSVDLKINVLDNGSGDNSLTILKKIKGITLLENKNNKSFTSSYNQLWEIRRSECDLVLILSNDVYLKDDSTLLNLSDSLSSSDICVAPKSIRESGEYDTILKPYLSFKHILLEHLGFKIHHTINSNKYVVQDSCLLIKNIKTDLIFNEKLKFYYTEDELCDRLREHGTIKYNDDVSVTHGFQYSTKKRSKRWFLNIYWKDAFNYIKSKNVFLAYVFFILSYPILLLKMRKNEW
jgi:GT2 family glycosyltransferase